MVSSQLDAIREARAQVARFEERAEYWATAARQGGVVPVTREGREIFDNGIQLYYRWMVKFRNLAAWWRIELHRRERGDVVVPNVGLVMKPRRY